MFTTEPAENVSRIVEEHKMLITRASLLCKEYIKMLGCDYGYSVYDVAIEGEYIYFKYKHYDGVMWYGPPAKIPLSYLSNQDWEKLAEEEVEKDKKERLRYASLRSIYEEKYLVPEFVVTKYLEDIEGNNDKAERLEWLRLREKYSPLIRAMASPHDQLHHRWTQR